VPVRVAIEQNRSPCRRIINFRLLCPDIESSIILIAFAEKASRHKKHRLIKAKREDNGRTRTTDSHTTRWAFVSDRTVPMLLQEILAPSVAEGASERRPLLAGLSRIAHEDEVRAGHDRNAGADERHVCVPDLA
jgi:hypothetical protein